MSEFSQVEEKEALKNRQVKHYGYEFNYDTNDIGKISMLNAFIILRILGLRIRNMNLNFQL